MYFSSRASSLVSLFILPLFTTLTLTSCEQSYDIFAKASDNSKINVVPKLPGAPLLAPLAHDLHVIADFNRTTTWTIRKSTDVSDPNGGTTLEIDVPENTQRGAKISVEDDKNNSFSYTPVTGFRGTDRLLYTVTNAAGLKAVGTVTIDVQSSVRSIQPSLAVRAIGCTLCHANVDGTLLTDHGFGGDGQGHDYFFGANSPASPILGSIYGDFINLGMLADDNWKTANVKGPVVVPKDAVVPYSSLYAPQFPGLTTGPTLADYVRTKLNLNVAVSSGASTAATVKEATSLYIGAPTAERILSQAGDFPAAHPLWKFIPHSNNSADLSGLEQVQGNGNQSYFQNSANQELVCQGDLIIKGVLLLNNATINTTAGGCRIYVVGSAFVQGALNYSASGPADQNLQLVSTRSVSLGISTAQLQERFFNYWVNGSTWFTRAAPTNTTALLNQIVADSAIIPNLLDASASPDGRNVAFSKILINAPYVQSRYTGDVNGTIIAEVALFSLGAFKFHYDDVFTRVPILPLLDESDYLSVSF